MIEIPEIIHLVRQVCVMVVMCTPWKVISSDYSFRHDTPGIGTSKARTSPPDSLHSNISAASRLLDITTQQRPRKLQIPLHKRIRRRILPNPRILLLHIKGIIPRNPLTTRRLLNIIWLQPLPQSFLSRNRQTNRRRHWRRRHTCSLAAYFR